MNHSGSYDALFDTLHGQGNWSQTGFSSREIHTAYAGLADELRSRGARPLATDGARTLAEQIEGRLLLVVPPATGTYNPQRETWPRTPRYLFRADEIAALLRFVQSGGRLLGFAYRFGDSFTASNTAQLFAALGCLLNENAVLDLETIRATNVLNSEFEIRSDCIPLPWASRAVSAVRWRCMASLTILPGVNARVIAFSPGGKCIAFDRAHREVCFQSAPIAVAGVIGRGRFVLVGGPHVFETGTFGLLDQASNRTFLGNVLDWILGENQLELRPDASRGNLLGGFSTADLCLVGRGGKDQPTVAFVERLLRKTGTMSALGKGRWAA